MKARNPLLFLALAASCAAPAAQDAASQAAPEAQESQVEDQLAQIQQQLEAIQAQLLMQQSMIYPQYQVIPPIRITPVPGEGDQQKMQQDMYKVLQEAEKEGQTVSVLWGDSHPVGEIPLWDVTRDSQPTTPPRTATLELKKSESGRFELDLKISNPIGGPTVHHYLLQQLGSRWSLTHTGSTEYL
ncbi:MAG: hypothetical protein CMJ94_03910 [Planctomycetes bacterium]|nr:hypothetical protein [Planctomycetota bacterium]